MIGRESERCTLMRSYIFGRLRSISRQYFPGWPYAENVEAARRGLRTGPVTRLNQPRPYPRAARLCMMPDVLGYSAL